MVGVVGQSRTDSIMQHAQTAGRRDRWIRLQDLLVGATLSGRKSGNQRECAEGRHASGTEGEKPMGNLVELGGGLYAPATDIYVRPGQRLIRRPVRRSLPERRRKFAREGGSDTHPRTFDSALPIQRATAKAE